MKRGQNKVHRQGKSARIDELIQYWKSSIEVLGSVQQTPKEPKDKREKSDKVEIKQTKSSYPVCLYTS